MAIPRDTPIGTKIVCVHDEPFDNSVGIHGVANIKKGEIYTISAWSFGTDKFNRVCYGVEIAEIDCSNRTLSRMRFELLVKPKIERKQTEKA